MANSLFKIFPESTKISDEEGFPEISRVFRNIAKVELEYEMRFRRLIGNIEKDIVFSRDEVVRWKFGNSGFVQEGKAASITVWHVPMT